MYTFRNFVVKISFSLALSDGLLKEHIPYSSPCVSKQYNHSDRCLQLATPWSLSHEFLTNMELYIFLRMQWFSSMHLVLSLEVTEIIIGEFISGEFKKDWYSCAEDMFQFRSRIRKQFSIIYCCSLLWEAHI